MPGRAEPSQRPIELRGEQEHEEPALEVEAAVEQPQTDADGHQGRAHGGQELEDEGGEEGDAEHAHRRDPERLARGGQAADRGLGPAEGLQRGEAGHGVQEGAPQTLQVEPLADACARRLWHPRAP